MDEFEEKGNDVSGIVVVVEFDDNSFCLIAQENKNGYQILSSRMTPVYDNVFFYLYS
jgi:hypothetical protein